MITIDAAGFRDALKFALAAMPAKRALVPHLEVVNVEVGDPGGVWAGFATDGTAQFGGVGVNVWGTDRYRLHVLPVEGDATGAAIGTWSLSAEQAKKITASIGARTAPGETVTLTMGECGEVATVDVRGETLRGWGRRLPTTTLGPARWRKVLTSPTDTAVGVAGEVRGLNSGYASATFGAFPGDVRVWPTVNGRPWRIQSVLTPHAAALMPVRLPEER